MRWGFSRRISLLRNIREAYGQSVLGLDMVMECLSTERREKQKKAGQPRIFWNIILKILC